MRSPIRRFAVLALLSASVSGLSVSAGAQPRVPSAQPRPGAIAPTESALYAAVRARPHDARARAALGRYLVARGATRVGMTLLEEAIRFGGDTARIEPDLARAYLKAGEYRSLAALRSVAPGERERARWLAAHESRTIAPDSILLIPFQLSSDSTGIGRISLRLDGRAIDAVVSSSVVGIVVSDTTAIAGVLRRFPGDADRGAMLAVADSLGIGALSISNVPVTISPIAADGVIVGLDVLGQFIPTFDPAGGQVTLRVGLPRLPPLPGTRFVTWRSISELQLLQTDGWISVTRPSVARMLREHRWTFDAPRGALIVEI